MTIKTKLSEKDFINASLATIWSRKYLKIFLIVFLVILAINIFNSISRNDAIIPSIVPPILIFGMVFFVFRFSLKNAYKKNYRSSENIDYNFTDNHLLISGESFSSEMTWDKIYKVTKTKNWILIWQSSQTANAIPLNLVSAEDLIQLKNIMQKNNTANNI